MKELRRRWTKTEDEYLKANVQSDSVTDIAIALDRSAMAVYKRIVALNLSTRRMCFFCKQAMYDPQIPDPRA